MNTCRCYECGSKFDLEDLEIILVPYPHVICPECGEWIEVNE